MATKKPTLEDLTKLLGEDRFDDIAKLGQGAAASLRQIAEGSDVLAAAKAISVYAKMKLTDAAEVVAAAARNRNRAVRVAAAVAAAELGARGEATLEYLLKSKDASIRKWAIRSSKDAVSGALHAQLEKISQKDPIDSLRESAAKILKKE